MRKKVVVAGSTITASQMKDFWRKVDDGTIGCDNFNAFLEDPHRLRLNSLPIPANGAPATCRDLPIPAGAESVALELAELERLFGEQVTRLIKLGYHLHTQPEPMTEDKFRMVFAPLRAKLTEIGPVVQGEGWSPFAICIPGSFMLYNQQMPTVVHNGRTGQNYLPQEKVTLANETRAIAGTNFAMPYLAVNVEDGRRVLGKSPNTCMKQFKQEGRFGLTVDGVIAVAIHAPFLGHHNADAPGSGCGGSYVPGLYLDGGRPRLDYSSPGNSNPGWGSASCGRYLGL